jgi:hypothetical protein
MLVPDYFPIWFPWLFAKNKSLARGEDEARFQLMTSLAVGSRTYIRLCRLALAAEPDRPSRKPGTSRIRHPLHLLGLEDRSWPDRYGRLLVD